MKFTVNSPLNKSIEESNSNVVFICQAGKEKGTTKKSQKPETKVSSLSNELNQIINEMFQKKEIAGSLKESTLFRNASENKKSHVLCVGLGSQDKLSPESLRIAGAITYNQLKNAKLKNAQIDLSSLLLGQKESSSALQAYVEGLILASYQFDELKSSSKTKKDDNKYELEQINFVNTKKLTPSVIKKSIESGEVVAQSINFSRRLGDMPGNLMTPEILANHTIAAAKGTKVKVTVWDKARIKKEKMGGLLGVSLGSAVDPRFIIMQYNGAAKSKKPVVFVGKGLTFDSGGISIKPSAQMDEMRYDMCGGANVIGTVLAIAKLGLKVNVIGLVPSTENMPGPLANKPGDVLTFRNGKTCEVLNTDAEGRLILADALCYASEQKPAAIFDAATLTGAMVVALSNIHTGFFTRDEKVRKKVEEAGSESEELIWAMPLCDFHSDDIKGSYSDVANISSFKGAGSSTAAAFLEHFVEKDIPWAHFDIAGTGWACGNRLPYCSGKGATGVMIRTFIELAQKW